MSRIRLIVCAINLYKCILEDVNKLLQQTHINTHKFIKTHRNTHKYIRIFTCILYNFCFFFACINSHLNNLNNAPIIIKMQWKKFGMNECKMDIIEHSCTRQNQQHREKFDRLLIRLFVIPFRVHLVLVRTHLCPAPSAIQQRFHNKLHTTQYGSCGHHPERARC